MISLGRRCASKAPLLCHACVCELKSLELTHSESFSSDPGQSLVRVFERHAIRPVSLITARASCVCVHLAKSRRAVAALLAYTGGYPSFHALQYRCARESAWRGSCLAMSW